MPAFLLNGLKDFAYMVILVALQVIIFNNIHFMGFANPYIYILFLLLFPLNRNKYVYLIYALLIGLAVDFFEHTGGVNAFASVFVAYLRHFLMQIFFARNSKDENDYKLSELSTTPGVIYLVVMIFTHHFLVDILDNFRIENLGLLLQRSAIGGAVTLLVCIIFLRIFPMYSKNSLS